MNQKKNLLTAALAVLTAFSSVSAQGGEDGGSTYEKFRVGGYGEMVANFKDYGINRYWGSKVGGFGMIQGGCRFSKDIPPYV